MTIQQVKTYRIDCDGRYEKEGMVGRCPVSILIKAHSEERALEKLPDGWKVLHPGGSSVRTICSATHVADTGE